jgi:hypothetical protein
MDDIKEGPQRPQIRFWCYIMAECSDVDLVPLYMPEVTTHFCSIIRLCKNNCFHKYICITVLQNKEWQFWRLKKPRSTHNLFVELYICEFGYHKKTLIFAHLDVQPSGTQNVVYLFLNFLPSILQWPEHWQHYDLCSFSLRVRPYAFAIFENYSEM